jgi:uncharacterized MAPEG superfamily protein
MATRPPFSHRTPDIVPMTLAPGQTDLALVTMATAMMWLPYTIAMIARGGLMAAMGNRDGAPDLPPWAQRARRAHANAVENLILFAPLLLLATSIGADAALVALAARIYLIARLFHYVVYAAGLPVVRTLAFVVGWAATVALGVAILS